MLSGILRRDSNHTFRLVLADGQVLNVPESVLPGLARAESKKVALCLVDGENVESLEDARARTLLNYLLEINLEIN